MNNDGIHTGWMIVDYLLLTVKVGFLVAILTYGYFEYRRWSKKNKRHE